MVISSSTPLTLRGLRHLVLSLDRIDGRNHYVDGCVPLDSSELLFAVQQHSGEPYKSKSADKARKKLRALVSWLERNGYDEAAGSLREGMEETLTVVKLALPESLRKSLATTNSIENLNGTIRRVSRNVKRWKSPSMIRRWTALGVVTAEKKFRRIKGYRHMGALVQALRSKQKSLDSDAFAA